MHSESQDGHIEELWDTPLAHGLTLPCSQIDTHTPTPTHPPFFVLITVHTACPAHPHEHT
jgi:hypothetical protein